MISMRALVLSATNQSESAIASGKTCESGSTSRRAIVSRSSTTSCRVGDGRGGVARRQQNDTVSRWRCCVVSTRPQRWALAAVTMASAVNLWSSGFSCAPKDSGTGLIGRSYERRLRGGLLATGFRDRHVVISRRASDNRPTPTGPSMGAAERRKSRRCHDVEIRLAPIRFWL